MKTPRVGSKFDGALPQWAELALRHAGVTFTATGVLLFLCSTAAHGFVFNRWGLNFVQVATPADVLMSGLSLAISFLSIGFALAFLYWLGRKFGGLSQRRAIGFAGLSTIIACFFFTTFVFVEFFGQVASAWRLAIILASAVVGFSIVSRLNDHHVARIPRWAAVAFVGCFVAIAVYTSTWQISRQGFFLSNLTVSGENLCRGAHLLWSGERHAVVRCPDSREFLIPSEELKKVDLGYNDGGIVYLGIAKRLGLERPRKRQIQEAPRPAATITRPAAPNMDSAQKEKACVQPACKNSAIEEKAPPP